MPAMTPVNQPPPSSAFPLSSIETKIARDRESQATPQQSNTAGNAADGHGEEKDRDEWLVQWGENDPGNPLNTPPWRKWSMVIILATSASCVTAASSMAALTYPGMERDLHVGVEVCTLSITLYIFGLAVGPMVLAPASEFLGRGRVMHLGFLIFLLFQFPVAFGNNIAVHLIFRFLSAFGGSAFLSVSGGAITDVFENAKVGTPMMIFSSSPFIGPIIGPLVSGFINQHVDWRWTWYVMIMWSAVQLAALLMVVRETLSPELLRRRAVKLRKEGEQRWVAPVERSNRSFGKALAKSMKTPFLLLATEPMVLLLNSWVSLLLGILYLFFGGIPFVFTTQYGFNTQDTGMAFLGIGVGEVAAVLTQPLFNKQYRRIASESPGGKASPESRLIPGYYGAILSPLGLFLFGLTSFKRVHWIVPIIMSSLYGASQVYAFNAVLTYLVDAYRPVGASALASNTLARCAVAGVFPLFGRYMYERLGAVGGTCLLGGLTCLTIPLPFVFHRIGARIRQKSKFGAGTPPTA